MSKTVAGKEANREQKHDNEVHRKQNIGNSGEKCHEKQE